MSLFTVLLFPSCANLDASSSGGLNGDVGGDKFDINDDNDFELDGEDSRHGEYNTDADPVKCLSEFDCARA